MLSKDIFMRVFDDKDRRDIISELIFERSILSIKGDGEKLYDLRASEHTINEFICVFLDKSAEIKLSKKVTASFKVKGESYFFKSQCLVKEDYVVLDANFELYKLQRRNQYRIEIPERLGATFNATSINDKPSEDIFEMTDVSAGGCKLKMRDAHPMFQKLKKGDRVKGELIVPEKIRIELTAEVIYIKEKVNYKNVIKFVGFHFLDTSPAIDRRLFSLTLEIYREVNTLFGE
jgi:c-di-GMP-binding flagellar brake protein YcgR